MMVEYLLTRWKLECMPCHQTGGPSFDVPTGRRDGLTSNIRDADVLPDAGDSISVLRSRFAASGLDDRDLVLLTGRYFTFTTCIWTWTRMTVQRDRPQRRTRWARRRASS
jgi:hypothetical protein